MFKRQWLIAFALSTVLLSGLAFQNCNRVHTGGTSDESSSSIDSESGNAGGYSGKPYVDVGGALDCPNGKKVRARIFVADNGSGTQTVDGCSPIPPRAIAPAALKISTDKSTLSFLNRVLVSESNFNVVLSCAYTYSTTSAFVSEQTLVAQNGAQTVAIVYRSVKSSVAYTQTSAPFPVLFGGVNGSATQSQFAGAQGAATFVRVSPFDTAAYTLSGQLDTPIQYSLPLVDANSGQSTIVQSNLTTPVTCAVYR